MTYTIFQHTVIRDILTGVFLCTLIFIIMYMMPLINLFAWMFMPLPILFYRLKTGRTGGFIIMVISLFMLILTTRNTAFNPLYFGSLLITGFFLGECIEKHLSMEKIILFTCFAVFSVCTAVMFIYAANQGTSVETLILNYVDRYKELSSQMFSDLAAFNPRFDATQESIEQISTVVTLILPGIIIMTYLTMLWLNVLIIRKLLVKKGIVVKTIENLILWKAPDHLVFGLILVCIGLFLPISGLKIVALNLLIVLLFVYFFQGIAIVSFFLNRKNAPFVLKIFFYALLAIQPLLVLLIAVLGLFDTWINFRKFGTAN